MFLYPAHLNEGFFQNIHWLSYFHFITKEELDKKNLFAIFKNIHGRLFVAKPPQWSFNPKQNQPITI